MPDPVVTAINEGMWRAAAEDHVAVQRCTDCGTHRYPPAEGCYRCLSLRWTWAQLPGTGEVYSFVWIPNRAPVTSGAAPLYNVAVVTLDGTEGDPVRILTNVVNAHEQSDLHVGQQVEVVGVPFADGVALPCFRSVG